MLFERGDEIQGSPQPPGLTHLSSCRHNSENLVVPKFLLAALRVCAPSLIRDTSARLRRCAQDGGLCRPGTEGTGYDLAQQIARASSRLRARI
jgi:hypothetical protein